MEAAPKKERLFTFASVGWVLLLAFVFTAVGTVWKLARLFDPNRVRPRGDGRTAASYGPGRCQKHSAIVSSTHTTSGSIRPRKAASSPVRLPPRTTARRPAARRSTRARRAA